MKNISSYFCLLFLICTWLFLGLYALNLEFYARYNVPFGMSDIDRYVSWLGYDLSYRTEYSQLDTNAYLVHGFFLETVRLLGGVPALNWFIPLLIVSSVLAVYILYRSWKFSESTSFYGSLLFGFGSFFLVSFYIVAFYAQLYSFLFICLALILYRKNFSIFLSYMIFSVLAHYMAFFFWIIFILSELAYYKKYWIGLVLSTILLCYSQFYDIVRFTRFYVHSVPEPSMYVNLAIFTFPITFIFLFNSPLKKFRYKYMIFLLLFIVPIIHLGRGLVYLSLFISPLTVIGFLEFKKQTKYRYWFVLFILVLFIFWLDYTWSFQVKNMLEQMSLRGMGENLTFINIFR